MAVRGERVESRAVVIAGDDGELMRLLTASAQALELRGDVLVPEALADGARSPGQPGRLPRDAAQWHGFWSDVPRDAPVSLVLALRATPFPGALPRPGVPAADVAADAAALCTRVSAAVVALARASVQGRVLVVTRAVQQVTGGDALCATDHGVLWGLAPGLVLEAGDAWGGIVDVPALPTDADAAAVLRLALDDHGEDLAAVRSGELWVSRLVALGAPAAPADASLRVHDGATYVVTGGLGGLGRAICRDLVARGARHLWLAGRTAEVKLAPAAAAVLGELRGLGVDVRYAAVDCDDPSALAEALREVAQMPPVCGILHGAGVVAACPLRDADEDGFARVLRGKLSGAWWLHLLSRDWPLDFFIVLSSVSSLWGTEGHAAYGAANGGIDAIATYRASRGLPAASLQFGPWSAEGIADEAMRKNLARIGVGEVSCEVGCASIVACGAASAPVTAVCPVQWPRFAEVMAVRRRRPLFAELAPTVAPAARVDAPEAEDGGEGRQGALAADLLALAERARVGFARQRIGRMAASVLGHAADALVVEDVGFLQLGFDSVMTVDLAARLSAELGWAVAAADVFDHPSVVALATYVVERLQATAARPPAPVAPRPSDVPATARPRVASPTARASVAAAGADAVQGAGEPIAVVGMAGRFPGAASVEDLWQLLCDGRDGVGTVPSDRWDAAALQARDALEPGKIVTDQGGFLDDVARFDAGFFRISAREAENLDPQHRMLLEESWHALEDAGIDPTSIRGSRTGVFVGISNSDYAHVLERGGLAELDAYYSTGTSLNAAPGRVAYVLGLMGPAVAIDTACSSSLVALHLAIRALRNGEVDAVLAGGVNAIVTPVISVVASKAHMLSPTGRCHTFSAAADGYCRAEGCGMLVLKRLCDAERDGDRCRAVLQGSAINQDGASSGLTAPSGRAQEAVIAAALRDAGVLPSEISYLEAHGTGTPLGDPIEIAAAWAALGRGRPAGAPLLVGSIKSNLGHCESAAGVAGVIKTILALEHRSLPANLHCEELNPRIPWQDMNVRVVDGPTRWRTSGPRLAGVSSFGFSGTNAHVIVGEAPPLAGAVDQAVDQAVVLPLSAPTADGWSRVVSAWRARLAAAVDEEVPALAAAASAGRAHFAHRRAVVGRRRDELLGALQELAAPEVPARAPRVAFVFSGQGSQYFGMGRGLYQTEPVFRRVIDACDRVAAPRLGIGLPALLHTGDDKALVHQTWFTQPALVALELALAALWESWGVAPHVVLGHSVGEIAAAIHGGVLPLEAGMELVLERGRLMQDTAEGAMAAVSASLDDASRWLTGGELDLAAVNGPQSIVVAGAPAAVEALAARLRGDGVAVRPLVVSRAFHSRLMDPMLAAFGAAIAGLRFADPQLPMLSNLTGRAIQPGEIDAQYWLRHARSPVLFHQSAATLRDMEVDVCVEIGPDLTLGNLLKTADLLPAGGAVASLRRGGDDRTVMLAAVKALYERGQDLRWAAVQPTGRGSIAAPRYPFARTHHWPATSAALPAAPPSPSALHDAVGSTLAGARVTEVHSPALVGRAFAFEFSAERPSFLADHRLFGHSVVVAGAAQVATALTALARGGRSLELEDVVWPRALVIEDGERYDVQVVETSDGSGAPKVSVHSRAHTASQGAASWREHLSARARFPGALPADPAAARRRAAVIDELAGAADRRFTGAQCYAYMRALGYTLGDSFCWIDEIWVRGDEALVRFAVPASLAAGGVDRDGYELHPGLIDSFFQGPVAFAIAPDAGPAPTLAIPFSAAALRFVGRPAGEPLFAHVRALEGPALPDGRRDVEVADLHAFTRDGASVMIAERFRVRRAPRAALDVRARQALSHAYELAWVPTPGGELRVAADRSSSMRPRLGPVVVLDEGAGLRAAGDGGDAVRPGGPVRALVGALEGVAERVVRTAARELGAHGGDVSIVDASLWARPQLRAQAADAVECVWALAQRLRGAPARAHYAVLIDGAVELAPLREAVCGMLAALEAEQPDRRLLCVEVDPQTLAASVAEALAAALSAPAHEARIALREDRMLVARLVRLAGASDERSWPDASALVSGGLGGLGLSVATGLAARGIAGLVLFGRSAPDAAARQVIAELGDRGVDVRVIVGDVAAPADCARAVAAANARAPLRAVFHLAGVLDDCVFERMTRPSLERVFAPKAAGADALVAALARERLDTLVLFSSASSVLGSPGQTNYAAANGYLDGLAELLRARGVPACSVNWGPWSPRARRGMAAPEAAAAASGVHPLDDDTAWPLLDLGCQPGRVRLIAVALDPARFAERRAGTPRERLVSDLLEGTRPSPPPARAAAPRGWLIAQLERHADPHAALRDALCRQVCEVLGESELDDAADFADMGLDSIMLIDLRARLAHALAIDLPSTTAIDHPNLTALTRHLMSAAVLGGAASTASRSRKDASGR